VSCTIVLVHGAVAGPASLDGVIDPLVVDGQPYRGELEDRARCRP